MRTEIFNENREHLGYCENGLIFSDKRDTPIGSYYGRNIKNKFGLTVGYYKKYSLYYIFEGYEAGRRDVVFLDGNVYLANEEGFYHKYKLGEYKGPDGGAAAAALYMLFGDLI